MSVRKGKWTTAKGEEKEAWVVSYRTKDGKNHIETYERKKDADARHAEIKIDLKRGTHVAPSESITVAEAGSQARSCNARAVRKPCSAAYHALIGDLKLTELSVAAVRGF